MPKRTLEEMCEERYDDEEVRAHVIESAEKAGTRELIEAGKCTLPTHKDARIAHHRATGKLGKSSREIALEHITKRQDERLVELESTVAKLMQSQPKAS